MSAGGGASQTPSGAVTPGDELAGNSEATASMHRKPNATVAQSTIEANTKANTGADLSGSAHLGAAGRPRRIVAIDGPAGAGKSTVAARLAERFGLLNLETGAMYRAFALKALQRKIPAADADALEELGRGTTIALELGTTGNRVLLDGEDVTAALRSPEVTQAASEISVHAGIRTWMVGLQRELGARGNVVMEGRDIGTAVFPDADVKVFLDASPEARSQRRYQQVRGSTAGSTAAVETREGELTAAPRSESASDARATGAQEQGVLAEMRERDQRDRNRAASPLRPAPDAVVIDSTELTLEQVIEQVAALVTARWAGAPHP